MLSVQLRVDTTNRKAQMLVGKKTCFGPVKIVTKFRFFSQTNDRGNHKNNKTDFRQGNKILTKT